MFCVPRWCYSWASGSQRWSPQNEAWTIHPSCRLLETIPLSLTTVLHELGSRERLFHLAHLPPHSGIWFCPTQTGFSRLPWLSVTTGNHCKLPLLVHVVRSSPLNMLCHALSVGSLPFDIMKLGTWQLIYSQKSAMTSASSLNLYPLMVRCSPTLHLTVRMVQDWISLLMVFGVVDSNVLSSMCKFLILMLPLTDTPVVTESTSLRRSATMNSVWERLNILYSSCFVSNWWYGQWSNSVLQEACLSPGHQMGSTL